MKNKNFLQITNGYTNFETNFLKSFIKNHTTKLQSNILLSLFKSKYIYFNKSEKSNTQTTLLYNILYFFEILKSSKKAAFYNLITKYRDRKINPLWISLNLIKSIYNMKIILDDFIRGAAKIKLLKRVFELNKHKYIIGFHISAKEYHKKNISPTEIFGSKIIKFYSHIIDKYVKYNRLPLFRLIGKYKKLSLYIKKRYLSILNYRKGNFKRNIIYKLALRYIGKRQKIPYARKRINKAYRSYRIFLYRYNLKPDDLRKITRKNRKFKNGGSVISHISYYQFNVAILLILANFCKTKSEVKEHIRNSRIVVNGKVVCNLLNIFKPFDIIHFTPEVNKIEKNNFMKDLMASESNNFVSKMNTKFFEYNFTIYCFIILPELFSFFKQIPTLLDSNSGRFSITKN